MADRVEAEIALPATRGAANKDLRNIVEWEMWLVLCDNNFRVVTVGFIEQFVDLSDGRI